MIAQNRMNAPALDFRAPKTPKLQSENTNAMLSEVVVSSTLSPTGPSSNLWGNQLGPCRGDVIVDRINRLLLRPTLCINVSPTCPYKQNIRVYPPNRRRHHTGGSNGFEPLCSGGYTSLKK